MKTLDTERHFLNGFHRAPLPFKTRYRLEIAFASYKQDFRSILRQLFSG